jgi:hypothetical protein
LIPQEECQNYIRVLAMKSPGRLLLCGTHAYKPMCREYSYKVKLSPPPKKKMSLCAILAGSWDSILTFFTNDDIDWPCG